MFENCGISSVFVCVLVPKWEIRALAAEMHRLVLEVAPALFADAGPACLRGKCPEGEKKLRADGKKFVKNEMTC